MAMMQNKSDEVLPVGECSYKYKYNRGACTDTCMQAEQSPASTTHSQL